jgi:hypothetical protein
MLTPHLYILGLDLPIYEGGGAGGFKPQFIDRRIECDDQAGIFFFQAQYGEVL